LGEKLGENEIKIIELMKDNKYITAKELSGHIKISTSDTPSPLRGRIKVGVRYFLSLRTLIYQGSAISISKPGNWLTKLNGGLNMPSLGDTGRNY
jgi:hypothetical protein